MADLSHAPPKAQDRPTRDGDQGFPEGPVLGQTCRWHWHTGMATVVRFTDGGRGALPLWQFSSAARDSTLPTFMNTLYDGENFLKAGVRRKSEQESRRFQRSRTVEFEEFSLWAEFSMDHTECVGEPA